MFGSKKKSPKQDPRERVRIPVAIKVENWADPYLKGHILISQNISLGGMRVEIFPVLKEGSALKKGDNINLAFCLPDDPTKISVTAEVRWIKQNFINALNQDVTRIGLKFTIYPDGIKEVLGSFVSKMM